MAYTPKSLIDAKDAESVQTTQYTATNVRTLIQLFTATNTTAGALTISVNIVPAAASAGDSNLIVDEKQINAGETYNFPELAGHILEESDFISTLASATGLTIKASGVEIT